MNPLGELGQGLVEYALLLFLVALAAMVGLGLLGQEVADILDEVVDSMD